MLVAGAGDFAAEQMFMRYQEGLRPRAATPPSSLKTIGFRIRFI